MLYPTFCKMKLNTWFGFFSSLLLSTLNTVVKEYQKNTKQKNHLHLPWYQFQGLTNIRSYFTRIGWN